MKRFNKAGMSLVVLAGVSSLWAQAASQPAAATAPAARISGTGTVTGNDVYVRSGFSTNYYPVLKLQKGDRVNVVSNAYGWLEITPPPGAFSLVEKTRVDKTGENTGTVNDLAQVYAGSDLSEHHYAKQVKLGKGEKVRIIGETADGDFYKMAPPEGATLWISGDFVKSGAGGESPAIEPVKTGELTKAQREAASDTVPVETPKKTAPAPAKPSVPPSDPQLMQANRDQIRAIETEITDELRKPATEQNLEALVGKLNVLAEQKEDITAQVYAKTRIEQLRAQMELTAALAEMKQLREDAVSKAEEIARQRQAMKKPPAMDVTYGLSARGEIRVSGLYDGSGGRAKRWRLVDPKTNRTIAYIELPPGSSLDPVQYYGKYVGVRATSYQLLHGTVPPLPVYVINSIEMQDPNRPAGSEIIRKEALASPEPPLVAAPASQPSVSRAPETRPAAK